MKKIVGMMALILCLCGVRVWAQEPVTQVMSPESKQEALPFPISMPQTIPYPRQAIQKGWEGQTVVAAEVLPDGSVRRTALAKTSGHAVLDRAAQNAIKTWKFGKESEPEDTLPQYVDIPVTFKLEDRREN